MTQACFSKRTITLDSRGCVLLDCVARSLSRIVRLSIIDNRARTLYSKVRNTCVSLYLTIQERRQAYHHGEQVLPYLLLLVVEA